MSRASKLFHEELTLWNRAKTRTRLGKISPLNYGTLLCQTGHSQFSAHYYHFMNGDTYLWTGKNKKRVDMATTWSRMLWSFPSQGLGDGPQRDVQMREYRKTACRECIECHYYLVITVLVMDISKKKSAALKKKRAELHLLFVVKLP